jgi:aspartate/methionine/tyrosine aminotransferase
MGAHQDRVPFSGIIRIRDMMYGVKDPFRLDQGDVSFDVPDTVKDAMRRAIAENRTHYAQTTGVPRLLELLASKMRERNGIPIASTDEVMVTTGGIHGVYISCMGLLEPGDEVIVPDPEWPPCMGNIISAQAVPVPCPLHEDLGWRWNMSELAARISPRTRAIYVNTPNNPTGGVFTRDDLQEIGRLAREHDLWVFADEAYEDVIFDDATHVSIASFPGLYERTIPLYTFSKSYAMTGLRLGYLAVRDSKLRERMKKVLFYSAGNVPTVVQYGGIGALEGSQAHVGEFRRELQARRDVFCEGIAEAAGGIFTGAPPKGAFYAFLRIDPSSRGPWSQSVSSPSWAMAEHLIKYGRIGCVPGADFGEHGEGYIRFCFARDRQELAGALDSMRKLFAAGRPD